MGQTPAETKREIEDTRAQLTHTLAALETKAHAALDWKTRVRRRPWLSIALAGTAAGLLVFAGLRLASTGPWRRRPRRSLRDWWRRVQPGELRLRRVQRMPADAQAWLDAQRALMQGQRSEPATRRILIRAAEAGVSALAAGLVKMLLDRARQPRSGHPPVDPQPRRKQ